MTGENILLHENQGLNFQRLILQLILFKEEITAKVPEYFRFNKLNVLLHPDTELDSLTSDNAAQAVSRVSSERKSPNDVRRMPPRTTRFSDYMCAIENILGVRLSFAESLDQLNLIDKLFHWQAVAPSPYLTASYGRRINSNLSMMTAEGFALGEGPDEVVQALLRQHDEARQRECERVEEAIGSLRMESMETPDRQVLRYLRGGSGERTLVIVNAYGQSLDYWTRLLANLIESHRVIIWFARGNGRQTVGMEQFNPVSVHAEDLDALLSHERVEQCDLLGWCTGPKLMLEYYARHPEKVATMIFLMGAFKNFKNRRDLETAYEKDLEPLFAMVKRMPKLAGPLRDTLRGVLLAQKTDAASVSMGNGNSHERAREMLSMPSASLRSLVVEPFATEDSVRSYAEQSFDFWEHDISTLLPRVQVPVLSISGECDRIASPRMSKVVAEIIPRAIHLEVSGGSHYLHYEKYELMTEIINGFLKQTWDFDFKHNLLKRY